MRRIIDVIRRAKPETGRPRRARRAVTPSWRRPRALFKSVTVVGAMLAGGTLIWAAADGRLTGVYDSARAGLIEASAAAGLVTGEVFVVGREKTSRGALIDALGVTLGEPMLAFDAEAARSRIEALGWVREATVERRFPDTVFLRIKERKPLALWQRDGKLLVIGQDGVVIEGAAAARFSLLPVIVGDDAPIHAAPLLAVLASEPDLKQRVAAAVRVGGRRWNLRFDNGIDVELPEMGMAAAWRRLAEFERTYQLLARDITVIDLRLPDRLVVRPAGAFNGWNAGGENT